MNSESYPPNGHHDWKENVTKTELWEKTMWKENGFRCLPGCVIGGVMNVDE